jgi:hypothetical protein
MNKATLLVSGLMLSMASWTYADCNIELQHDIRVNNQSMGVTDHGKTLYEIRQGGHLSIDGKAVNLSSQQQALTEEYAGEIAALALRWITMVSEALALTESSLEMALGDAFGPESQASVKTTVAMAQARENFERKAMPEKDEYRLFAEEYNDLEGTLEDDIEDSFNSAMGAVFSEIGRSLTSGEGSFMQKIDAFGVHMKRMGETMGNAGKILEETGEELCVSAKGIQLLEREIAKEIPKLAEYPLFD